MDDKQYTGDDLLELFDEINVNTGNLHPNVIRAWFDTDCPQTTNLLNWMCSAISKKNIVPVLDKIEFQNLKNPLEGIELDEERKKLEADYPGIFKFGSITCEIELLQQEVNFLGERNSQLDNEVSMNRRLLNNLDQEIGALQSEEVEVYVQKEQDEKICLKLSQELDELHLKLYQQIHMYHGEIAELIHAKNQKYVKGHNIHDRDYEIATNNILLMNESIIYSMTDSFVRNLLSDTLLQSYKNCFHNQLQVEILQETLTFMQKINHNTFSDNEENMDLRRRITDQNVFLHEMLDEAIEKSVNHYVNESKRPKIQQRVDDLKLYLGIYSEIEKVLIQLFSMHTVFEMLLSQDNANIDSYNEYIQSIFKYVVNNIYPNLKRQEALSSIINNFEELKAKPIEKQVLIIEELGKLLDGNDVKGLGALLSIVHDLQVDLNDLQKNIFIDNPKKHWDLARELCTNIDVLKKFIFNTPTKMMVGIPPTLRLKFKEVDNNLKKQQVAVKSGVNIWSNHLKEISHDKWSTHQRQLWMHFVTSPHAVQEIIDQLQKEVDSMKKD